MDDASVKAQGLGRDSVILPLFAWLSPSYPVGCYAYSHALEWAVEAGDVSDETTLVAWLTDLLTLGLGRNDAILLSHAYRAVEQGHRRDLETVNELALALSPSAELYLETSQQGRSFLDATLAAWPSPHLPPLEGDVAFPVAIGMAAAAHGVPLPITSQAYLFGLVQTLVSAAIRLAPIGQTAGIRVSAALAGTAQDIAHQGMSLTLDNIGGSTFRADLGSFHHENQYTRLFRS
ncbi:urease accessory protein UreF [Microvirga tunisiensis]|uniref:Urease accessory protein UreF n=1 Tax=Microvirga tunisiensis TaxID=2108360 RepID=A0A5N7MAN4_9HYPH|nr:urease accessory UreF family protein [Microvirga tunisiensis]MPR05772.1 urease accessory protein UreF [Microvirga tunisiensis]MPR23972.1 urease accessory protein UreF [Microvirga tunisiensis]